MNLKNPKKITVGLSGGILCGKTTALSAWEKAGAFVLSCDELVREISVRPAVQKKITAAFGTCEPAALAHNVFSNAAARRRLEKIVHPLVYKELAARLNKSTQPVRVVEVPLLFEARWEKFFDVTVALLTPEKLLAARAKQRGIGRADWAARRQAQLPQTQKAARADICILNDGTKKDLSDKIKNLQNALSKIYNVK